MQQATSDADRVCAPTDRAPKAGTRASVFGLDVRSEIPLRLLEGQSAGQTGSGRELSVRPADPQTLDWPRSAELVCDSRQRDGGLIYQIESHAQAGYLISGPDYGAHLLAADGRRLQCAHEGLPDDVWQRLLIAQILPFAAVLQGLEVFHASAVFRHGHAIALLGPSGAGKTSLALELCRLGCGFLADDVLALEPSRDGVLAHPGTAVAGVAHTEARPPHETDEQAQTLLAVNARERLVRVRGGAPAAPLMALFFLDRRADGPEHPRFEPVTDPQILLSATFNFVLATPARLRGLLEVCALAARQRVERIIAGPATGPLELARAIERRLGSPA